MANQKLNKEKEIERLLNVNKRLNLKVKELNLQVDDLYDQIADLESTIQKLERKSGEHQNSFRRKGVTVLYIHIEGYGELQKEEGTSELYDRLDELLIEFDKIAKKHGVQRIKIIGDDYACAGGIEEKNSTNAIDVALTALEIHQLLVDKQAEYRKQNKEFWKLKIGIHSGSGTVLVKGTKKLHYDLKGEVLNIIPRVSALAETGQILITDYTYELIKSYFSCKHNGKLPVKYRGHLDLYELKRIKKVYSEERGLGVFPNNEFMIKYHLRQFHDIEEKVLNMLQEKLPKHLYYHNYKHTIDVVNQAELIGYGEGVNDEQILLLKTAALFHDTGHTIASPGHERLSCDIAREWLPKYNYSPSQIDQICDIIMATELPPTPQTLLQRIICDSDLDYLGRTDFIPISNQLFEELKAQNVITDLNEWNKLQVKFLTGHQFFTATSQRLREVSKQKQIERIEKLIV